MGFKPNPHTKILILIIIVGFIISPLFMASAFSLQLTTTSEYTNYVQTYINSPQGNYTVIDKPIFPVLINDSQIPIGGNWTVICPLQAGHNYHIYCYGSWINTSSTAKTDYDFYVYDPEGNLVSTHTESAGLPPHLGTTVDDPFFTPTESGNYSFVIINNPVDSVSAQEATFMIIENLQCDQWYTSYIQGTTDNQSNFNTCWAYEFVTNASYVQLYMQVANTLDMYEARLYLMNNGNSSMLDNCPLAWEPGLYGNLNGSVGGYNFESEGYRGVAYASCEYMGQSMSLNYTSTAVAPNLYQLALIGEVGAGNVTFMLKTNFENGTLTPLNTLSGVSPNNATELSFTSSSTALASAQLTYTTNDWNDSNIVDMQVSNQTCEATIPSQPAGTIVQYMINATDVLENPWTAQGNYTVKQPLTLNITAVKENVRWNGNITINGVVTPNENSTISLELCSVMKINDTITINCTANSDGTFVVNFKPNTSGEWSVYAWTPETQTSYASDSNELMVTVAPTPLYVTYSLYIVIGFASVLGVGIAVYVLKSRQG